MRNSETSTNLTNFGRKLSNIVLTVVVVPHFYHINLQSIINASIYSLLDIYILVRYCIICQSLEFSVTIMVQTLMRVFY